MHIRRKLLFFTGLFLFVLISTRFVSNAVQFLMTGDLDYNKIFKNRFSTYIQTVDCSRNFDEVSEYFPDAIIVNSTSCPIFTNDNYGNFINGQIMDQNKNLLLKNPLSRQHNFLHGLDFEQEPDPIRSYLLKYAGTLEACAKGDKMLCLILEDDVVFLNQRSQALQRIVSNTLSWFTNDDTTWDCSKRGMGFFKTGYTGNTSICRIIPKKYAACLAENMRKSIYPADIALKIESSRCRLIQSRFLLTQHSGAISTLGH